MLSKDFVEVALAADKNYIVGLNVTICSIARSCSPGAKLRFQVLFSGFSEADKADIKQKLLSCKNNSEVLFYDVSKVDFSFFPLYASSRMTYARLILPQLLSSTDYVIYTDVDTLWLDDISELWQDRSQIHLIACPREQSGKTLELEEKWFTSTIIFVQGYQFIICQPYGKHAFLTKSLNTAKDTKTLIAPISLCCTELLAKK